MGAMLAAGAANAVTVNSAGLGDLLVAPSYFIGGGWQAERKAVTAPGDNEPVTAWVVVRDIERSPDRLDFAAYLSPGGVSVGTLKGMAAGANARQPDRPALHRT